MKQNTIKQINPALQNELNVIVKRLQRDDKFLDLSVRINNLTEGQYNALYNFVRYMLEKDEDIPSEFDDPDRKYACKYL